jgi:signal transduction histidine kinase
MKVDQINNKPIRDVIERSFLMACFIILVIIISSAVYFNFTNLKSNRENSIHKTHEVLSHLLIPGLSISNTIEVIRLLKLASTSDEIFGVADANENIFIPDYTKADMIKQLLGHDGGTSLCNNSGGIYRKIGGNDYWINCTVIFKDDLRENDQRLGILLSLSKQKWPHITAMMIDLMLVGAVILLLIFMWFRKILHKKLLSPLIVLVNRIQAVNESHTVTTLGEIGDVPSEVYTIKNAFENAMKKLTLEYQRRTQAEKNTAMLDLAARVAHDIRSPLATMEANLHILMRDIPKEKLTMMNIAIQSVRDISNNLLEQYRAKQGNSENTKVIQNNQDNVNMVRFILLFSLVDQVISQKRYEWLNNSCKLTFDFSPESKSMWIKAAPAEVKRMISNLLNNAIEACDGKAAYIHLNLSIAESFLELKITDNGMGISEDMIESYLNGMSSKHAGDGLGLSNAKNYIESVGGQIDIASTLNSGTTVLLRFIHSNPAWYPDQILLSKDDEVVVLDDDAAMQSLWMHKLENFPVKTHYFNNYSDAESWIQRNLNQHDKMILLVDYELSCESENGLMLLKRYGLGNNSYLITSHAEEFFIQKEADKLKVRLIPKSLASEVTIKLL